MRKKVLLEQNLALFEQLQKSQLEVNELKGLLKQFEAKITSLENQIANEREEASTAETVKNIEKALTQDVELEEDVEYGAKVIGDIVVSATQYSNRLTVGGDSSYRELVNLILGKTEVAKSEILTVVSSAVTLTEKKNKIDDIFTATIEYFESVMAQRM